MDTVILILKYAVSISDITIEDARLVCKRASNDFQFKEFLREKHKVLDLWNRLKSGILTKEKPYIPLELGLIDSNIPPTYLKIWVPSFSVGENSMIGGKSKIQLLDGENGIPIIIYTFPDVFNTTVNYCMKVLSVK